MEEQPKQQLVNDVKDTKMDGAAEDAEVKEMVAAKTMEELVQIIDGRAQREKHARSEMQRTHSVYNYVPKKMYQPDKEP